MFNWFKAISDDTKEDLGKAAEALAPHWTDGIKRVTATSTRQEVIVNMSHPAEDDFPQRMSFDTEIHRQEAQWDGGDSVDLARHIKNAVLMFKKHLDKVIEEKIPAGINLDLVEIAVLRPITYIADKRADGVHGMFVTEFAVCVKVPGAEELPKVKLGDYTQADGRVATVKGTARTGTATGSIPKGITIDNLARHSEVKKLWKEIAALESECEAFRYSIMLLSEYSNFPHSAKQKLHKAMSKG